MRLVIDIVETSYTSSVKGLHETYPKPGLYLNTDENKHREYILVFGNNLLYYFNMDDFKPWLEQEVETQHGIPVPEAAMVSENFALKMLAVTKGHVKNLDLG